MSKVPKEHCIFKNENGEQCRAYQAKGTLYCYGHARKLGVLLTTDPELDKPIAQEVARHKKLPSPPTLLEQMPGEALADPIVRVDEPEVLKALRQMQVQIEMGGSVDPVLATQLSNIIRPYMGIDPMGSVELARITDSRIAADEQIARAQAAKMNLIDRSRDLIREHPSEEEIARAEARVARDINEAAQTYRAKLEYTKAMMLKEPKDVVWGTGQDEIYMINGVKIFIPAEGQYQVPRTIAGLHRERIKQRKEKKARSELMQSSPEYHEVQRKMAEIDTAFGSRSQLGGGQSQEESDYLVAEEIK